MMKDFRKGLILMACAEIHGMPIEAWWSSGVALEVSIQKEGFSINERGFDKEGVDDNKENFNTKIEEKSPGPSLSGVVEARSCYDNCLLGN